MRPIPFRKAAFSLPLFLIILLFACMAVRSDAPRRHLTRLAHLPRFTLWAWERREDLRSLNPQIFAVAYLDQTITLGPTVHAQPRRDPVAFSAAMTRIPVVRIEIPRDTVLSNVQHAQALEALIATSREPGIAALQIDFDATRSQRAFYRNLLVDLRRRMPANLPLSITALASWCSSDDWLRTLPIDEAVPMFFRMEPHGPANFRPTRTEALWYLNSYPIREPLCQSSIGVSTTEPWPTNLAGKRLYIFPDRGWQHEIPSELPRRLE